LDVPPPGVGFTTVMLDVPVAATSAVRMVAVRVVLETKVVVRGKPFQSTVELLMKFVPVTVSVKLLPPAKVEVGEIEVVIGAGFAAVVMVKVCAFEVPPPGVPFVTVTGYAPTVATSAARIVAVTVVDEMKVVLRADPLKFTTEPLTKFVPETVRVNCVLPAAVEVGLSAVVVGTGFRMLAVVVG
jgi:hypothetical protein